MPPIKGPLGQTRAPAPSIHLSSLSAKDEVLNVNLAQAALYGWLWLARSLATLIPCRTKGDRGHPLTEYLCPLLTFSLQDSVASNLGSIQNIKTASALLQNYHRSYLLKQSTLVCTVSASESSDIYHRAKKKVSCSALIPIPLDSITCHQNLASAASLPILQHRRSYYQVFSLDLVLEICLESPSVTILRAALASVQLLHPSSDKHPLYQTQTFNF